MDAAEDQRSNSDTTKAAHDDGNQFTQPGEHSTDGSTDLEKGQETPPEEKEEQVRKITGFRAIISAFGNVDELPWLSVGFMIGGVAMIMPYGKFYNLLDAKWVYIGSFILFQASSALCGGAPNMTAEIIGRVFAGAGGNGMYLGLLTLISVNTTDRERPAWLSLSGLMWGFGTVLGPVVGGGFELYNWRWAFYINLLLAAIIAPIYLFILPSFDPCPGASFRDRLAKFDILGSVLSIGAIVCLIMGINFGGVLYDWNSGSTIALFVVSGILFIVFALQQIFTIYTTEDDRVFPVHLVLRKEPVLLFVAGSSGGAAIYIPLYYIPIYFQFTRGDSAIQAAVRLLPFVFILSTMVMVNAKIDVNTSTSAIYGYEVLIAFGTGSFVQGGFAIIQTIVTPAEMSYGITLMLVAQLSGLTLGLSVAGAVFLNLAQNDLGHVLPNVPKDEIQQLVSGTSSTLFKSLTPDVRAEVLAIIVNALRTT
ncbi:MAG: hypothetical protein Q9190_000104 [Brigantiaea leucoxantha]